MKKLLSSLCAFALTGAVAVTAVVPSTAGPIVAPRPAVNANVIDVQTRGIIEQWQQPGGYRQFRRGNRHWSGQPRFRHNGFGGHNFVHRGNAFYLNGHRGYRHRRAGYRHYNGFWFPAGAFIAGAIIGNAFNNPAPVYRERRVYSGDAHVEWCYNRYRSYRDWDNSFQPYHGPRQQCYSPYS